MRHDAPSPLVARTLADLERELARVGEVAQAAWRRAELARREAEAACEEAEQLLLEIYQRKAKPLQPDGDAKDLACRGPDPPPPLPDRGGVHDRSTRPQVEHSVGVDPERVVPLFRRDVLKLRAGALESGVVDQDSEPAELGDGTR